MYDNNELRSQINQLQRECNQLESENREMRRELDAISSTAANATSKVGRTANHAVNSLVNSTNVIEYSNQVLEDIIQEEEEIKALHANFKNMETANKRIRELNNNIYFEFSNFRMARKIVRAFLDNLSLDMVNQDLIFRSIEKEHLQAPDFWLTCAMLAIMHWKADEKALANRAVQKALEIDRKQSILFFMSFNLLLGRNQTALNWFKLYRKEQKTGLDAKVTLLLLHTVNFRDKELGELEQEFKDYLMEEYEKSKGMNNWNDLVGVVKAHLVQYNSAENYTFNNLRSYVKDYAQMANMLALAKDNDAILEFIQGINTATRGRGYIYVERFTDELLEAPSEKEKVYRDEIEYNEEIIRCAGDIGRAQDQFKLKTTHDNGELNVLGECVNWVFMSGDMEISEVAKGNIFILCRDLFADAAEQYAQEYRAMQRNVHPVAIKDYKANVDFTQKAKECKKVEEYYKKRCEDQLSAIKGTKFVLCIVFAALLLVGGIVGFAFGFTVLGVMGLIGMAILGIMAIVEKVSTKKKIARIKNSASEDQKTVLEVMEKLFAEYASFMNVFHEKDKVMEDIQFAIHK